LFVERGPFENHNHFENRRSNDVLWGAKHGRGPEERQTKAGMDEGLPKRVREIKKKDIWDDLTLR